MLALDFSANTAWTPSSVSACQPLAGLMRSIHGPDAASSEMRLQLGHQLLLAAEADHAVDLSAVFEHDHGQDPTKVETLPEPVELVNLDLADDNPPGPLFGQSA